MKLAIVGHVEWVEFVRVEHVPEPGDVVHALETWEEAAGGGAVDPTGIPHQPASATS